MPVAVSLEQLVVTPGTHKLWPEQFVALMAKVEGAIHQNSLANLDRTAWAVIADWCREQEEHELAGAFMWLSKRAEVWPVRCRNRQRFEEYTVSWSFNSLPEAIRAVGHVDGDVSTLAGAVAVLAERLRRVREAIA